ncbi:MAG: hypothetical protein AAF351_10015 [Pseudomonadota bacterium]
MKISGRRKQQRGAALLIMMLVVLVAATATLVTRLNANDTRIGQQTNTQATLALARDALLNYARINPDMSLGEAAKLPCPDIDASGGLLEGVAHAADCGAQGVSVLGRLPWRTLGITPPKDAAGACLWYVVSGSHKDANTTSAAMINDDTTGQLQLFGIESGQIIAGIQPDERPVALLIAPMQPLQGQTRAAPATDEQCSANFTAGNFLDTDSGSGISNASISGTADVIDLFAIASGYSDTFNDRIIAVMPSDMAEVAADRHDFLTNMRELGLAATACIADYANKNPGGVNDRRLPWPASMQLTDYRDATFYDDTNIGFLSGRLPDIVNDSNVQTGNSVARVLSDCDTAAVPTWTPDLQAQWQHWKDHFFYAVSESYAPSAVIPSSCGTCLTVNATGTYAAAVLFSAPRLAALGQRRDAPPIDIDTRDDAANYLESTNSGNIPYSSGSVDFTSQTADASFNDLLFCIDGALAVTEC